jgi:hypothetical protein
MPYNNPYNRGIANELHAVNERFAHLYAYSPVDGRGNAYAMDGGSTAGVLYRMGNASKRDAEDNVVNDNLDLPPVYYYGNSYEEDMKGGNGFARGTFRDRGDGLVDGVASGTYVKGGGMSGGDIIDRLMQRKNMSESQAVKYAQEQGYYDTASEKAQRTSEAQSKADAEAEANKAPTFWQQVGSTLEDVAGPVAELAVHALGAGKHAKGKEMGQALQHMMKGCGAWEDIGSALLHVAPLLLGIGKKKPGRPKKEKVGGAILGNPDPYPVQGDSKRLAGRGRGRPKKAALIGDKQHDLLAMPSPVLANGVPPTAQLRGAYGGAKPLKEKLKDMLQKNLSGMTDKRGSGQITKQEQDALQSVLDKHKGAAPKAAKAAKAAKAPKAATATSGKRQARAALVKKIMQERGVKMIEASSIIKKEGLTY